MKLYVQNHLYPQRDYFKVPLNVLSKINLLIILHVLVFMVFSISSWKMLVEQNLVDQTLEDFSKYFLTLSANYQEFDIYRLSSAFTYQFIHFSFAEMVLSISMLWLFGHILQNRLSQFHIVLVYFASALLAALVFNLSHFLLPIYSGANSMMDGAFGGVLGVMSVTVFYYHQHSFRIFKKLNITLWKVFALAIFISLFVVFQNNIASILVFVVNIFAGYHYAEWLKEGKKVSAAA